MALGPGGGTGQEVQVYYSNCVHKVIQLRKVNKVRRARTRTSNARLLLELRTRPQREVNNRVIGIVCVAFGLKGRKQIKLRKLSRKSAEFYVIGRYQASSILFIHSLVIYIHCHA